ncbi:MAG: hypothetical protein WD771_11240 [Gemmatimonadaceae bacterium]
MIPLLWFHITGGALALAGGYTALFARKGGRLHRAAGTLFVFAMLLMGATATVLAIAHGTMVIALGGPLVAYLVITAVTTLRPAPEGSRRLARSLMVVAFALAISFLAVGVRTLASATGSIDGVTAPPILLNGVVALFGGIGDARVMQSGPLRSGPRLARHLWRMCFACFMAAGSFFLGQADVIPEPLRILPLLALLAFLPILMMLWWLWRVRARRTDGIVTTPAHAQASLGLLVLLAALALAPDRRRDFPGRAGESSPRTSVTSESHGHRQQASFCRVHSHTKCTAFRTPRSG